MHLHCCHAAVLSMAEGALCWYRGEQTPPHGRCTGAVGEYDTHFHVRVDGWCQCWPSPAHYPDINPMDFTAWDPLRHVVCGPEGVRKLPSWRSDSWQGGRLSSLKRRSCIHANIFVAVQSGLCKDIAAASGGGAHNCCSLFLSCHAHWSIPASIGLCILIFSRGTFAKPPYEWVVRAWLHTSGVFLGKEV